MDPGPLVSSQICFSLAPRIVAGHPLGYSVYPEIIRGFTVLSFPPKLAIKYLAFIVFASF